MNKYIIYWFNKKVIIQLDIRDFLDFKIYAIKGKIFVKVSLEEN